MEFKYSFHCHTYRCGHAEGDVEDYVKEAIKYNYEFLGISDHVFLPEVHQPRMRGDYSLLDEYIETVNKAKEKYKDQLPIYLSFECEYVERFVPYYESLLKEKKFDYLIVGQHMTFGENLEYIGYYSQRKMDDEDGIERFKYDVIHAIRSGLFMYVAHPDVFMLAVTKYTPFIEKVFNEIVDEAIKYDIPLELNISGFNRLESDRELGAISYPCKPLWEIAKKKGAKIIYGGDYHFIHDVHNERNIKLLDEFINELGLEFVDPKEVYTKYRERIAKK